MIKKFRNIGMDFIVNGVIHAEHTTREYRWPRTSFGITREAFMAFVWFFLAELFLFVANGILWPIQRKCRPTVGRGGSNE